MSIYPIVVGALTRRLRDRPRLRGVNILRHQPTEITQLRTGLGKHEAIWVNGSSGPLDVEVLTGGALRLTERDTVTVSLMAVGTSSADTAQVAAERVGEMADELFAVIATQQSWNETALGLAAYDYFMVKPTNSRFLNDRIEDAPGQPYGALQVIDLTITARRGYD